MLTELDCWFAAYLAVDKQPVQATLSFAMYVISFVAFLTLIGWLLRV